MRKVLTIVLALSVLVGCDKPKPIGDSRAISFASQYNRALVEDVEDLRQHELKLFGSYSLDGRTARLFDAERLFYNTELPGWDYDNTQFWISGATYRFCAVYPYVAPCEFNDNGEVEISGYEGSTGGPDVLYAVAKRDLAAGEDYSTVLLHFHHACAALQFNLINGSNQTLIDVRNIRLVGLQNKGNFLFNADGGALWSLDGSTIGANDATQHFAGTCVLPNGGLPVNIGVKHSLYENGAILVLPQYVYKTNVTLHLEYIKQGDSAYAIRDIELGKLGGTTPTEWKPGEKYEYNLTITDNTITTEVKVVDWVDNYVDL